MKFIYITCNVSMLETVTRLLDEEEITDYQVMEQITAKSSYSSPRLNTAVWPGYNSSVLIQESDTNKVSTLIETINKMNQSVFNNGERIALFSWDILVCTEVGFANSYFPQDTPHDFSGTGL